MNVFTNAALPGDLLILPLEFHLKAQSRLSVPEFSGSVFRGLFARALKQMICTHPDRQAGLQDCNPCTLQSGCSYFRWMEPANTDSLPWFKGSDIPRPYLIIPPKSKVNPDKTVRSAFRLRMNLFGQAVQALPLFIYAMEQAGRLSGEDGPYRGRFSVQRVFLSSWSGKRTLLYESADRQIGTFSPLMLNDLIAEATQVAAGLDRSAPLLIHFNTPVNLKSSGRLMGPGPENAPFSVQKVADSLLERLAILAHFHQSAKADDRPFWHGPLPPVQSGLRWHSVKRYSNRHQSSQVWYGFTGSATIYPPWTDLFPLLWCGQYLSLGRHTTFGFGHYRVHGTQLSPPGDFVI